jgi:aminopeptidase N
MKLDRRYIKQISLLSYIFIFNYVLCAQSLPEGTYHQTRERSYNILHYKAELDINMAQGEVQGNAYITLVPLRTIVHLFLNGHRLTVSNVELLRPQEQALKFDAGQDSLLVQFTRPMSVADTMVLGIAYTAQPNAGMYFQKDPADEKAFYCTTYGEGGLHANWLPIYNDVNDKFSSEMLVTVPDTYTVLSNGNLVGISEIRAGFQQFHWLQQRPHSNYLIALYIGKLDSVYLPPAGGKIPVTGWVPPGRQEEARYVLRNTPRMIEYFSKIFGFPYPWNRYDQVIIPDYPIGGMEHTAITGLRASVLRRVPVPLSASPNFETYNDVWTNEALISHELAHMWFGDLVTCRSLNYIWLHESFATFAQMLWEGEYYGQDRFYMDKIEALRRYLNYVHETHVIRPLEYARWDAVGDCYVDEEVYLKGALIVDMLKTILGEDNFYRVCSYYLRTHQFDNVESNDFKLAIEEVTGKNMNWFFNDWIYGAGHPVFEVQYEYLNHLKKIDLQISQIQSQVEGQDLFTLPVVITIATTQGSRMDTVWVNAKHNRFQLECSEKPVMVSFDGGGQLVAEINFPRSLSELIYQSRFDRLPGRFQALRQMAENYPQQIEALQVFENILSQNNYWGIQAEAASLLGSFHLPEAEKVLLRALQAEDYHVRKAAVLAVVNFRPDFAEKILSHVIEQEKENDVVATAIVVMARLKQPKCISLIRQQLQRNSWYDEIKVACMQAFELIADRSLVPDIKKYSCYPAHQHLISAALSAWARCAPDDPELHRLLMEYVFDAPYSIRFKATAMLGSLYVYSAIPILEKLYDTSGDGDLRISAKNALDNIERFGKSE